MNLVTFVSNKTIFDCNFNLHFLIRNKTKKMKKLVNNYLNTFSCYNLETGDFPGPVVTISRQAGCSAQLILVKLSKILTGYNYMSENQTEAVWEWVDKKAFAKAVKEMIREIESGVFTDKKKRQCSNAK